MITRAKANDFLKQLFGDSTWSSFYYIGLGLASSTPDEDGNNFEEPKIPSGTIYEEDGITPITITTNEYQRVHLKDLMETPSDAIIKNKQIIFFNEAEHYSWGEIGYFGIFKDKLSKNPIFWGEINPTITVNQYNIPIFRAGKLQIGIDNDPATQL